MSNVTNLKYKDEDGTGTLELDQIRIREVSNGWIVDSDYLEDGGQYTNVFTHADDLWDYLKQVLKI